MAGKYKIPEGPLMIQRGTSSYILIGQAKAIQYGNFSICVIQKKKKKKPKLRDYSLSRNQVLCIQGAKGRVEY